MELRPLGFGEIFDRAVTIYIRNFVPFAAIVMVLVLPLSVFRYFVNRSTQPEFDAMVRILQHPGRPGAQHIPTVFQSAGSTAALIITLLFAYTIWPFAQNAVAVGVARLYSNRTVEFRACYAAVLRRWLPLVGLLAIQLLIFMGWYLAVVLILVVIVLVAVLLAALFSSLAFWFALGAIVLVIALTVPLLAPLLVALNFAMYGVIIEEKDVIPSLSLGFARVFNRTEFWRAVLFAFAVAAVVIGASSMFSALSLLAAFAHLPGLQSAIEAIPRLVISPFGIVLLAIYYFDVRMRREGLDLEAALERLGSA
jgi:hypothetical protein